MVTSIFAMANGSVLRKHSTRRLAVVADQASVQKMTSLAMAPKPRLNFLHTDGYGDC